MNLREIKLERVCPTEGYIVSLITLEGKVVCSNFTNSESEAEKIAKKLSDFTCLEIYHGIIVDNSSD